MNDEDIVIVDYFANVFSPIEEIEEEIARISELPNSGAKQSALAHLNRLKKNKNDSSPNSLD